MRNKIQRLADEYIAWATDSFNADRRFVPAEARLADFVVARKLSRRTHSALYWHLLSVGVA